jgi:hypothetical protein
MISENKNIKTNLDVNVSVKTIKPLSKQQELIKLIEIYKTATGFEPKIWGKEMIRFGKYHYKYTNGREGNWFESGFYARKNGKSCLNITKLARFRFNRSKDIN